MTQDEGFRRAYISRQKALSDWTTGVNTAFEKGVEKGVKERNIAIARRALGQGLTVDVIEALTGLSAEDILTLQDSQTSSVS
ncbi:MAG: hypothetical protein LBH75_00485 [Treponema sp.]|nr:hypothetical protein [Treponema sp.]